MAFLNTREKLAKFSMLWSEAETGLRTYISANIYNFADAQDILQKVALTAFQKFDAFDSTKPFRAWATGIARNEMLGYFRDRQRHPVMLDTEVAEQLSTTVEDKTNEITEQQEQQNAAIEEAVKALPKKQQLILSLRYTDGLSTEEIAQKVDMSPGTVRVTLSRIREKLKENVAAIIARDSK